MKSRSTPKYLVAVTGETRSDSTIAATNGTKNDTIKPLCNQINYNNTIVEEAKTQREELMMLQRKEKNY